MPLFILSAQRSNVHFRNTVQIELIIFLQTHMHIYREISSLVAFRQVDLLVLRILVSLHLCQRHRTYMKKVKNLQIQKSSKRKNHRFIELKEKTCKVSETHLGDSILLSSSHSTPEPGWKSVALVESLFLSSMTIKTHLHPLHSGPFPNKVNHIHLYLHATPHPGPTGNQAEGILWPTQC